MAVFTNADLLSVVTNVASNIPALRVVIYDGQPKQELLDKSKVGHENSLNELRKFGKSTTSEDIKARCASYNDVSCIMYDGGSKA